MIWRFLRLVRFVVVSHPARCHRASGLDQVLLNARIGWAIYFGR